MLIVLLERHYLPLGGAQELWLDRAPLQISFKNWLLPGVWWDITCCHLSVVEQVLGMQKVPSSIADSIFR